MLRVFHKSTCSRESDGLMHSVTGIHADQHSTKIALQGFEQSRFEPKSWQYYICALIFP